MVRGLDRQVIFRDDADRTDFLARLADVVGATGLTVLAWVLLPNHTHLLVRTGPRPLVRAMRCLLTGYAGAFNRRHRRSGHLFQNRYKSILVEEEPYLLELVRYIHLNPLRAGLVADMTELERFPWAGHSAVVGKVPRPWQAVAEVLGRFGKRSREARRLYCEFVAAGASMGRRPELQGGGLVRSAGGWKNVASLRRGREAWAADERVLGSGGFVEEVLRLVAVEEKSATRAGTLAALPSILARCAHAFGLEPAGLVSGSRRRVVVHARTIAACLAVRDVGLPIKEVAHALGVSATVVREGVPRGEQLMALHGLTRDALLRGAASRE